MPRESNTEKAEPTGAGGRSQQERRSRGGSGSERGGDTPTPERTPSSAQTGDSGVAADAAAPGTAAPPAETPLTQQIGRVTVGVIAVLFGIFAVANAQFVSFDWIFGQTTAEFADGEHLRGGVPLIVLLVGSFALGAIVGWAGAWWSRRGTARRAGRGD